MIDVAAEAAKEAARVVLEGARRSHSLSPMDRDARKVLVALIMRAIVDSAFKKPQTWPAAVVVVRDGVARVTSRSDFSHFLRANALDAMARECTSRKAPRGSILVWLELDDRDLSTAGFVVPSLIAEARELWRS